jgi:hypothetical protein
MSVDPHYLFGVPGTFDPSEFWPENEQTLHEGGLDQIAPAYDPMNPALTGAIGYDPEDANTPSAETQLNVERGLPQWGPPFVAFVDERMTRLEKAVEKAILAWSFQTQTIVDIASVQTTAAGGLDLKTTPNCQIQEPPPGFTFALHRLTINIKNGTNNFGTPFTNAAGYWELRVGDDMIDGASLVSAPGLPAKLTYGTRDAPRCRDGEIMSLFMSGGPASTQLLLRIQGSLDRTIEG